MTISPHGSVPRALFQRLHALALLVCAVLVGTLPAQTPAAEPRPAANTALSHSGAPDLAAIEALIARGHAAEALKQLDALSALAPVPAGVDRLRGMAFYSQGKLPEADAAFAAAIAQDANDRQATQMRGITLFRTGRPAAAIPLLESLRSSPAGRTGSAAAAGKADDASADQDNAKGRTAPVDPLYVLALCYLDTRRYDDARKAFALQFGFPPESPPAYLLAARMLLRHEYLPIAQQSAQKALELSPSLPGAHELLGETALAGNHLDEAVNQFQAERKLNPLNPAVYDRLGDAYVRRGDFLLAQQALQEAILLEPGATGPFILLGKVLLKQNDPASAAGYLEHARQMDDHNFITHSLLGQAYRQMGRPDDAHRETAIAQQLQAAAAPDFQHAPK